jgi:TPP-dependent pyruvate/acetoin dehydrogenase alpha subunit
MECLTYRFRAHSMFDAQLYRTREEVAAWRARDPIPRLSAWLAQVGHLHEADLARIEAEIAAEIGDAVAYAEAGTAEPVEELERFVTMEAVPS